MKRDDYTEANRQMWNETASLHAESALPALLEGFADPDFGTLDDIEREIFAEIGVAGKRVVQLSCNNGRELLSVLRLGAAEGVGIDISDRFIEQARQLAETAGLDGRADFVRCDVYRIPHRYDASFDIAYVTIGALGWLPDLRRYFEVVARLLRPGGQLFIYEMHPMLDMFDPKTGLEVKHSYFNTTPFVDTSGPDYREPHRIVEAVSYWFPHTLSEVIGGCLGNGLAPTRFEEYGHDLSMVYRAFQDFEHKPALSYALVARKRD